MISNFQFAQYALSVFVIICNVACKKQDVVIVTKSGKIQGDKYILQDGLSGLRFLGIPFALPPIGERRFQIPESIPPWKDTFEATAFGPICFQPLESDVWDIEQSEMDIQTLHAQLKQQILDDPQKDQISSEINKKIQEVEEYISKMERNYVNNTNPVLDSRKDNNSQDEVDDNNGRRTSKDYANFSSQFPLKFKSRESFPGSGRKNKYLLLKRKYLKDYYMSEDCLTLNIYTPLVKSNRKEVLPVLVFIHGGSFYSNGGRLYPGERLATEGLIVITINYRLGPFGFLSTGDSSAEGNYGLFDQVEAMKWIHENVEFFGGDKKRILLAGNSAGGASVIFHVLSPLSKGLFSSVAAMSGCALAPWSIQQNPLHSAKKLAKGLKCPTDSTHELVRCLKKSTASAINQEFTYNVVQDGLWLSFAPVVDYFSNRPFLPATPRKMIEQGRFTKVPVLMMMTTDEVTIWFRTFPRTMLKKKIENWMDEIIRELYSELNNKTLESVSHIIRGFYTSEYTINVSKSFTSSFSGKLANISPTNAEMPVKAIANLFSDVGVRVPCMEEVILLSKMTTTFLAQFTYISDDDVRMGSQRWIGAYHESDLLYLFGQPLIGLINSLRHKRDRNVSTIMMSVFKSFAATGSPKIPNYNLKWLPYTAEREIHCELGENPKIKRFQSQKRYYFWMEFLPLLTEKQLPSRSSVFLLQSDLPIILVVIIVTKI